MEQYIKIGQIINTHGHKGEVKVFPLTDDPERFLALEHVFIKTDPEQYVEYKVTRARLHKNFVIVQLAGITYMNTALTLKNFYLELPESELLPLPEGHYYIFQIVGLSVYEGEQFLGKVTDVINSPANDLYLVETPQKKTFYIPAVKDIVRKIDVEAGRIDVQLPFGLLE